MPIDRDRICDVLPARGQRRQSIDGRAGEHHIRDRISAHGYAKRLRGAWVRAGISSRAAVRQISLVQRQRCPPGGRVEVGDDDALACCPRRRPIVIHKRIRKRTCIGIKRVGVVIGRLEAPGPVRVDGQLTRRSDHRRGRRGVVERHGLLGTGGVGIGERAYGGRPILRRGVVVSDVAGDRTGGFGYGHGGIVHRHRGGVGHSDGLGRYVGNVAGIICCRPVDEGKGKRCIDRIARIMGNRVVRYEAPGAVGIDLQRAKLRVERPGSGLACCNRDGDFGSGVINVGHVVHACDVFAGDAVVEQVGRAVVGADRRAILDCGLRCLRVSNWHVIGKRQPVSDVEALRRLIALRVCNRCCQPHTGIGNRHRVHTRPMQDRTVLIKRDDACIGVHRYGKRHRAIVNATVDGAEDFTADKRQHDRRTGVLIK